MAYRVTPDLFNLAQTDLHDFRNAKPRWQELAEITASPPISEIRYPDRPFFAPDENFDLKAWRDKYRGRQMRENISVGLGASRSRSRSRLRERSFSRGYGESWLDEWFRESRSVPPRHRVKVQKREHSIGMVALAGIMFSWLVLFWYPSAGVVYSIKRTPYHAWQNLNHVSTGVKYGMCRMPVFPKILNCKAPPETELLIRDNSIRHTIPGVLYALSESPEALDDVLDLLAKAKKGLHALLHEKPVREKQSSRSVQPGRIHSPSKRTVAEATNTESATLITDTDPSQQTKEPDFSLLKPDTWKTPNTRSETIEALITLVAYLKDHIEKFDSNREILLKIMRRRMCHVDKLYEQINNKTQTGVRYNSKKWFGDSKLQFRKAVEEDFGNHVMVLEGLRDGFEVLGGEWSVLFEQTGLLLKSDGPASGEGGDKSAQNLRRKSLFKRFILWASPIDFSHPSRRTLFSDFEKKTPKPLTPAQNREQLLAAIQDMYPQLRAIHASTSKAYISANLAKTMIKYEKSSRWTKLVRSRGIFDEDLIRGLRETAGMVPMLMEQRRGQRAERQYDRAWAKREGRMKGDDEEFEELLREYRRRKEGKGDV